ncbi:MAG: ATP-binding cassette domain-containing protein [Planctomycetota bacterium]
MIRLENVSCTFAADPQRGGGEVRALIDLDLEIAAGETMVLLGPSGCGKTTTLRLINRLQEPTSGRVLVDGRDVATAEPVRLRRGIGYVVQSGGLFPHLDVRANIGLLCELEGWERARIDRRTDELLELMRLPRDLRRRSIGELSGGQRQRVGVARAMALDPPILLMDEPFGALDPITRGELQRDFAELERLVQKTIVIVSHDLDEAFLLGDRIALLTAGRLVQVGTREQLENEPASEQVTRFLARRADA